MVEKIDNDLFQITYKNRTCRTKYYEEITDELYNEIISELNTKPKKSEVYKQLKSVSTGSTQLGIVNNYYFKDLMDNTKVYYNNWSIKEFFESKDLVGHSIAKIKATPDFYNDENSTYTNIRRFLQLGGKGVASEIYNFPLKVVNDILECYNINNNYYDFSCGWGSRLLGALSHSINYFGTDPNNILCDRLLELEKDFKFVSFCKSNVKLYVQGSELFIPELHNKIGVAFSSPPYYCLEDYKIGNQSYNENISYEDWLNNYLKPTIQNIYSYLIDNGYFLININDFDKYTLVKDTISIAESVGFRLLGKHTLNNIKRCNTAGDFNDNSEGIFVFCKSHSNNKIRKLTNDIKIIPKSSTKKLF